MTPSLASIVDLGQLLEVVEAALIAGIGVSVAFSLVIRGAVRASEHRQTNPVAAAAHGVMALVALLVCFAAIGFGVSTMLAK